MSRIQDRNVREAIEVLESEFHSQEQLIDMNNEKISRLEEENEQQAEYIEELEAKIKELENDVAEAYLTSEPDAVKSHNDNDRKQDICDTGHSRETRPAEQATRTPVLEIRTKSLFR